MVVARIPTPVENDDAIAADEIDALAAGSRRHQDDVNHGLGIIEALHHTRRTAVHTRLQKQWRLRRPHMAQWLHKREQT